MGGFVLLGPGDWGMMGGGGSSIYQTRTAGVTTVAGLTNLSAFEDEWYTHTHTHTHTHTYACIAQGAEGLAPAVLPAPARARHAQGT
jgi:hypothetical protein